MGKILGEKGSIFVALKNMPAVSCSEVWNANSPGGSRVGGQGTGKLS